MQKRIKIILMTNQQRDAWYFDILWSRIYDQDAKGPDITNFILGKKIEATARIGAIAYGKVQDDYGVYLSALLRARFEELASGELIESLETRKANYLTVLLKIFEAKLSKSKYPDIFDKIHDFLFNAPHAETDLEDLASWAYICSSSNVCEELLAALLKARFKELITGVVGVVLPTETKANSDEEVPRYREEDQQVHLDKFLKGSPQNHFLRSSIQAIFEESGMSIATGNKLLEAGLKKGIDIYNAHPDWLKSFLETEESEWIEKTLKAFFPLENENPFPRYREEVKDCKIEDFTIDSAQRNVLSASVSKLCLDGAFSKVTAQKLVDQGITTGMALFKTSSLWLESYLDANELQQVHELFIFSGLHVNEVAQRIETLKKMNDFLKTLIEDLDLSVRCINAIEAYNAGRPIEEQFITANDIYKTSVHDFLKMRNVGKKQVREITKLFAEKGLTWG